MRDSKEEFQRTDGRAVGEHKVRWSARRKEVVVMRLLRGESLDELARQTGQAAGVIASWRAEFVAAGREGLKMRPKPIEDRTAGDKMSEANKARS